MLEVTLPSFTKTETCQLLQGTTRQAQEGGAIVDDKSPYHSSTGSDSPKSVATGLRIATSHTLYG